MGSGLNKSCVKINGGVYYIIPRFNGFEGLVVCSVSGGEQVRYCQSNHNYTTTHDITDNKIVTRRIGLIQCNSECRHIPQCIRTPSPHRIQTHHTHTARNRPYNKCTRTPKISQYEAGTTTLNIAHPFTTTHSAHHQAF